VTILINNAGVVSGREMLEAETAEIEHTIKVNTLAPLFTTREFLPQMIKNRKGHIVTIASVGGLVGISGASDYCASKAGAIA
jgi:all-trans-retinol dehydrogenase (NAD+)